jgi:hypothetical protein
MDKIDELDEIVERRRGMRTVDVVTEVEWRDGTEIQRRKWSGVMAAMNETHKPMPHTQTDTFTDTHAHTHTHIHTYTHRVFQKSVRQKFLTFVGKTEFKLDQTEFNSS